MKVGAPKGAVYEYADRRTLTPVMMWLLRREAKKFGIKSVSRQIGVTDTTLTRALDGNVLTRESLARFRGAIDRIDEIRVDLRSSRALWIKRRVENRRRSALETRAANRPIHD